MKSQWMLATVFAACAVTVGCGSEGDEGGGSVVFQTSLPLEKKVSELSDGELKTLCKELTAAEDTSLAATEQRLCAFAAELSDGFESGSCQATFDKCMGAEHEAVGKKYTAKDYSDEGVECDFPSDCEATVEELRRCYEWDMNATADYYDSFSCEGEGELPGDADQLPEPCKALQTKCPAFFQ